MSGEPEVEVNFEKKIGEIKTKTKTKLILGSLQVQIFIF
jgi:hypothetical protein